MGLLRLLDLIVHLGKLFLMAGTLFFGRGPVGRQCLLEQVAPLVGALERGEHGGLKSGRREALGITSACAVALAREARVVAVAGAAVPGGGAGVVPPAAATDDDA